MLLRMDGEECLTTTAHTSVLFAERCHTAAPFLGCIASATGFNKEEWKTAVWTEKAERVKVCKFPDSAITRVELCSDDV